jgi:MtN3 and saliva related transmembrane protein
MTLVENLFCYIAGSTLAISALPQIIMIIKAKSVKGVSLFTNILLAVGNYCYLVFGILTTNIPMIIFDSICGVLFTVVSILKVIDNFKTKRSENASQIASTSVKTDDVVNKE